MPAFGFLFSCCFVVALEFWSVGWFGFVAVIFEKFFVYPDAGDQTQDFAHARKALSQ